MKASSVKPLAFLFISLLYMVDVYANIVISPTRVLLDERTRAARVALVNSTNKPQSYKLEWETKIAKKEGGYKKISIEEAALFPSAEKMLRVSPKRVSLGPNGRQIIKVVLRRPKGLIDGEYRSHLKFVPVIQAQNNEKGGEKGQATQIQAVVSFTIPVIVRQGKVDVDFMLDSAQILAIPKQEKANLILNVSREGVHGATGNFMAFFQNKEGKENLVAQVHGYNFYPELTQYEVKLPWPEYQPESGILRIEYAGAKEFADQRLIDKKFQVSQGKVIKAIP